MGQVLHNYVMAARTISVAIQRLQTVHAALNGKPRINVKTFAKWRKRETVEDRKTGLTPPSSTVRNADKEAMLVAFRRQTLLPMDDCLYALQPTVPHL